MDGMQHARKVSRSRVGASSKLKRKSSVMGGSFIFGLLSADLISKILHPFETLGNGNIIEEIEILYKDFSSQQSEVSPQKINPHDIKSQEHTTFEKETLGKPEYKKPVEIEKQGMELDLQLLTPVHDDSSELEFNFDKLPNTNVFDADEIDFDVDDITGFINVGDGVGSNTTVVTPPLVPTTPTAPPATVSNVNLGTLDGDNGVSFTNLSGGGTVTVSSAGDANGDGLSDVLLGDPTADGFGGVSNGGQVRVVEGANDLSSTVDVVSPGSATVHTFLGNSALEAVGSSVAYLGDVNDDGQSDFIIGAPGADESYTLFGDSSYPIQPTGVMGIVTADGYIFSQTDGAFSVGGGGDINGDGLNDAVVGGPDIDFNFNADAGAVGVLYGGNNPPSTSIIQEQSAGNQFGYSVDIVGDINGDGFSDIAISSPGENAVHVFYGGSGALPTTPSSLDGVTNGFTISNVTGGNVVVSAAGDMNKDGYADFAIGQPGEGGANQGEVNIIFGSDSLTDFSITTPGTTAIFSGLLPNQNVGQSVSFSGDVNADGFDDLIVGAPGNDTSYVIFGGDTPGNFATTPAELASGALGFSVSGANSGDFVSNAGDVNGDGFDDMLIGSTDGNAYLVYGRQTDSMILGDENANNLIGQEGTADLINGAAGNDTINGQGGGDVIHAASGDDTVTFYSNDLTDGLLDGGSGNDTLLFDDTNQTLDFSAFSTGTTGAIPIKNFEELDLSQADHTVTLDRLDLTNLSDTSNTLTVEGEAGDTVNLEHVGADASDVWTNNGLVDATHISYTNDNATLLVDQDVVVNIIPT